MHSFIRKGTRTLCSHVYLTSSLTSLLRVSAFSVKLNRVDLLCFLVQNRCCCLRNNQSKVERRLGIDDLREKSKASLTNKKMVVYLVIGVHKRFCEYNILAPTSSKHNNLCYIVGRQGFAATAGSFSCAGNIMPQTYAYTASAFALSP